MSLSEMPLNLPLDIEVMLLVRAYMTVRRIGWLDFGYRFTTLHMRNGVRAATRKNPGLSCSQDDEI